MSEVSRMLLAVERGEAGASEQLLPLVYEELRRLASQKLAREAPGHTLDATALVHEAYLRLAANPDEAGKVPVWDGRGHFFAAAAEAMRRILVENARRRKRLKRGGNLARKEFDEDYLAAPQPREDLLALDEALDKLSAADSQAAQLVKLRYFGGLTLPEAANILDISPRSSDRLWSYARAWLLREMTAS